VIKNLFQIPIPCRPQKTFIIFVQEIPEDIPEEDIRHALYKLNSVVEVTRIVPAPPEGPKPKIDTGMGMRVNVQHITKALCAPLQKLWAVAGTSFTLGTQLIRGKPMLDELLCHVLRVKIQIFFHNFFLEFFTRRALHGGSYLFL